MRKSDDLGYLHPAIRAAVEGKRAAGLAVHLRQYPHLCEQLDVPFIAYVTALLEGVIELRKEQHHAATGTPLEYYGIVQLFEEVYKNKERAHTEWFAICHKVSACPQEVLDHCEEVLKKANKKVPQRPSIASQPVAAK